VFVLGSCARGEVSKIDTTSSASFWGKAGFDRIKRPREYIGSVV
jgi:hypothetical protein